MYKRQVKTHEEAISLQNGMQSIGMISPTAISQHLPANYRFMHIGLVQVAVKPLLRTAVNAPIYLALRDKRLRHYKSSLLAMIQTNVWKGPIFFNYYPNFKVVLKFRSLSLREEPSLPGQSNYRRSFSDVSSQNLDPSQRYRFRSSIPEPIVDPPSPTSGLFLSVVNKGW